MILRIFKSNNPAIIFLIPILGVVLWMPSLFGSGVNPNHITPEVNTFVYNKLLGLLSFSAKAPIIVALLLLIVEAYILIRLNYKFMFIDSKTYMPAVLFVIFSSVFVHYQTLHPALIGNLFLLFAIDRAFVIESSQNSFRRYYESGLLLGLGALFYPKIFVFIVIIWLTNFILRTFNWREWFLSVIGLFTPFAFYLAFLFINGALEGVLQKMVMIINDPIALLTLNKESIFILLPLSFLITVATLSSYKTSALKKINTRKYFILFFWFLVYILILIFFYPSTGFELIYPLSIPLSIIVSIYFTVKRKVWVSELLFDFILISVIAVIWLH